PGPVSDWAGSGAGRVFAPPGETSILRALSGAVTTTCAGLDPGKNNANTATAAIRRMALTLRAWVSRRASVSSLGHRGRAVRTPVVARRGDDCKKKLRQFWRGSDWQPAAGRDYNVRDRPARTRRPTAGGGRTRTF